MKKHFGYLFIFIFLFNFISCKQPVSMSKVCFEDKCFNVEVVTTQKEMIKGLQFRQNLEENNGMLFIFSRVGIYRFWMKDTLIPLDIIWLNPKQEIVYLAKKVPPCRQDPCPSYSPETNALYVLEINSGLSEKRGLRVGQRASFHIIK
jgi:uncharacterized protein